MKRLVSLLFIVLIVGGFSSAPTRAQDRPQVVVSFSILGDVVQNVAGDSADITVLMPAGSDPHTYQPTPQDVTAMIEADVVFINGAYFEESLQDVVNANDSDINQVIASSCVPIIGFEGHEHEEGEDHEHTEGEDHEHEEGEDHEHAEGEAHSVDIAARAEADLTDTKTLCDTHTEEILGIVGHFPHYYEASMGRLYELECEPHEHGESEAEHEEGEHDHGSCDPHVWTDAHNVFWWVLMARDYLIQLDPANGQQYADNAAAYISLLDETVHGLAESIKDLPDERKVLITNHNTFGYFAALADFQVVEAIITGGGTANEPTPADFVALIETIQETQAPAIFTENTVSSDLAEQLADETGVEIYQLYTDSLSEADGEAATYIDYLSYNYQTIGQALGE